MLIIVLPGGYLYISMLWAETPGSPWSWPRNTSLIKQCSVVFTLVNCSFKVSRSHVVSVSIRGSSTERKHSLQEDRGGRVYDGGMHRSNPVRFHAHWFLLFTGPFDSRAITRNRLKLIFQIAFFYSWPLNWIVSHVTYGRRVLQLDIKPRAAAASSNQLPLLVYC